MTHQCPKRIYWNKGQDQLNWCHIELGFKVCWTRASNTEFLFLLYFKVNQTKYISFKIFWNTEVTKEVKVPCQCIALWLIRLGTIWRDLSKPHQNLIRGDNALILVPSDCQSGLHLPLDLSSLPEGQSIAYSCGCLHIYFYILLSWPSLFWLDVCPWSLGLFTSFKCCPFDYTTLCTWKGWDPVNPVKLNQMGYCCYSNWPS